MRAVTRAMLDDMPDPCDLHLERAAGRCAVMVGSAVLAVYAESDVVMRNFAVTTARMAGFGGTRVAEVFGLSAPYVSTLHAAALRDGSQALVKQPGPGRPRTLEGEALERARQWRAAGGSDRESGRRLGMAGTTAGRRLGPRGAEAAAPEGRQGEAAACEPLVSVEEAAGNDPGCAAEPAAAPEAAADAGPVPGPEAVPGPPRVPPAPVPPAAAAAVPPGGGAVAAGGGAGGGLVPGAGGAVAEGRVRSRYAGALLLHAFGARAGAPNVLAGAAGGQPWRGCWRRSAPASGWDTPRPSSSSTWRRPRPGRWPGWWRCRTCGPCARRWPASPTAPTRSGCSRCSPPRCSPRTR